MLVPSVRCSKFTSCFTPRNKKYISVQIDSMMANRLLSLYNINVYMTLTLCIHACMDVFLIYLCISTPVMETFLAAKQDKPVIYTSHTESSPLDEIAWKYSVQICRTQSQRTKIVRDCKFIDQRARNYPLDIHSIQYDRMIGWAARRVGDFEQPIGSSRALAVTVF